MDDYMMTGQCYKDMVKRGQIDKETGEKNIRIYEFLAACDNDDLCRLVDSGAFNGIIEAFIETAVKDAKLDEEIGENILSQLHYIFDEKTAKEVLEIKEKQQWEEITL